MFGRDSPITHDNETHYPLSAKCILPLHCHPALRAAPPGLKLGCPTTEGSCVAVTTHPPRREVRSSSVHWLFKRMLCKSSSHATHVSREQVSDTFVFSLSPNLACAPQVSRSTALRKAAADLQQRQGGAHPERAQVLHSVAAAQIQAFQCTQR